MSGYHVLPLGQGMEVAAASAWRGKWSDISGLYWLGARYYDPIAGRFLGADPLGHEADPSLYTFCGGDPINRFDPDGRLASLALNLDSLRSIPNAHAMDTGLAQGTFDFAFSLSEAAAHGIAAQTSPASGILLAGPIQNIFDTLHEPIQNAFDQETANFNNTQGKIYAGGASFSEFGAGVATMFLPGGAEESVATELLPKVEAPTAKGLVTVGDILAGHSSDTMIHLTTATEDELATATFPNFTPPHTTPGVFQGSSWVQLGCITHDTARISGICCRAKCGGLWK